MLEQEAVAKLPWSHPGWGPRHWVPAVRAAHHPRTTPKKAITEDPS